MNAMDGRVHGCLDSSAFVKGYTDTISPLLRSQVEIGSYITHINDHFVVGNTFASVLQLLREEKRPLRIRFEQGRATEDAYAYHGDVPVTAIPEMSEVERLSESLYDEGIHYLPNNVMIDSNHHAMLVARLLLTMRSVSTIDNVRFLLRRRSVVPMFVNGEWVVEKQPFSAYPRQLLLELLVQTIPQVLQQNQLVELFDVLNAVRFFLKKANLTRRTTRRSSTARRASRSSPPTWRPPRRTAARASSTETSPSRRPSSSPRSSRRCGPR